MTRNVEPSSTTWGAALIADEPPSRHAAPASPEPTGCCRDDCERAWKEAPGLKGWFGTVDHKTIGIRYLVTAFAFLLIGGAGSAGDARAAGAARGRTCSHRSNTTSCSRCTA